ncbi:MAG: C1 family peptidase [Bacteroidales bacterium]|nr:C1 family peptidase [Bacteroidales bacterium]MBQ9530089.1 C1 family peptidase [Bacteroidales bacterium]
MKRFIALPALFLAAVLSAQTLTSEVIKEVQQSFDRDAAATVAMQNILTATADIKSAALSHANEGAVDHLFKYKADVSGITDQQRSGRCWLFTSTNQLRPLVMKKYNLASFNFSNNYCYFWDIFEKANLFLENVIATADRDFDDRAVVTFFRAPVADGGVWNLFYNVVEKYGIVPASVMPETANSNNTSQMLSILSERLRKAGYEIREASAVPAKGKKAVAQRADKVFAIKMAALKDVYRVLALCLGEPPAEFTWRYQTKDGKIESLSSTPLDFWKEIRPADFGADSYIMIMNDPTREYYKRYEIDNYRNTYEGINWVYLNLPNEDIKAAALASLKAGEPMYASCDVGKQANRATGVLDVNNYDYGSLLGIDLKMDKKARILTRQSGSSHAMLLMACDTDQNDVPTKWQFENSWGPTAGHNGYLTFTDEWFSEYMFRVVINKKYLDAKALEALNTKPVMLPVWDYMF